MRIFFTRIFENLQTLRSPAQTHNPAWDLHRVKGHMLSVPRKKSGIYLNSGILCSGRPNMTRASYLNPKLFLAPEVHQLKNPRSDRVLLFREGKHLYESIFSCKMIWDCHCPRNIIADIKLEKRPWAHIRVHTHAHTTTSTCTHTCVHTRTHVFTHTYTRMTMHICTHMCAHARVSTHTHMRTHEYFST